jgi:hypothetical protein
MTTKIGGGLIRKDLISLSAEMPLPGSLIYTKLTLQQDKPGF